MSGVEMGSRRRTRERAAPAPSPTGSPPVVLPRPLQARFLEGIDHVSVVFLSAGPGWGKTTAARRLLAARSVDYIPLARRALPRGFPKRRLVVLDDFQTLFSTPAQRRFAELLRAAPPSQRFVLLSRGPLPEFLSPYEAAGSLLRLGREELALDLEALAQLARLFQAPLTPLDLRRLGQVTGGHPVAAGALLSALAAGRPLRREAEEEMVARVGGYLDRAVLRRLTPDTRQALLRGALFPSFETGLMETLTGGEAGEDALETLRWTTGLLEREGELWRLPEGPVRAALERWAAETCPPEERRALHRAAGEWYERQGDRAKALAHYRQGDSREELVRVLTDAARQRPDGGDAPGECYDLLTREEIERSPELMAAMSMRRSAAFRVEEAEGWYRALRERAASMASGDGERPRVRGLVAYLDLALPHRDSETLPRLLPAVARLLAAGELVLPQLPVTAGLPSVLRGGKDLSCWALSGGRWDRALQEPIERALGPFGVGLTEMMQIESRLERGEDVAGELPALAALRQRLRAEGVPEMELVAAALLARILCTHHGAARAAALLEGFRAEMAEEGHVHLLPNLDAMLCRLSLLEDDSRADRWLAEQAPEEGRLRPQERYRYLTKARCLIRRGELPAALLLLGRMLDDAQRFHRSLDRLESLILTAICRFRMGGADWPVYLDRAVELGARFGYVAVFAREGAALLPLLEEYDPRGVAPDYWERLRAGVILQAGDYGEYLRPPRGPAKRLTDREELVLRLVTQNRTNQEIARLLDVKVTTVKTHLRAIYQKLGVSSRGEAKALADRLRPGH